MLPVPFAEEDVRKERDGERLALLAWVRAGAEREPYENNSLVAADSLAGHPISPEFVESGPDGEVFLPATYFPSNGEVDEKALLGRVTEWRGGDAEPMRGVGQVSFLVGDERAIMQMQAVTFKEGLTMVHAGRDRVRCLAASPGDRRQAGNSS
jgi:hypothetical protein